MTETLARSTNVAPAGPVPPQAIDAEQAVLAALLLDPESVGRAIELIEPRVFYRVAHQRIYAAIVALYNRNEKADVVTLTEELRKRGDLEAIGGPAALAQLFDAATTSANLEQHIRIIHSKFVLRSLIDSTTEIQQDCYAAGGETAEILDRAEQRIFQITDERVRQGFVPLRDLLKPAFEHIQLLFERKAFVTGVPSGYDDLDQKTAGFQPGEDVFSKVELTTPGGPYTVMRLGPSVVLETPEISRKQPRHIRTARFSGASPRFAISLVRISLAPVSRMNITTGRPADKGHQPEELRSRCLRRPAWPAGRRCSPQAPQGLGTARSTATRAPFGHGR